MHSRAFPDRQETTLAVWQITRYISYSTEIQEFYKITDEQSLKMFEMLPNLHINGL